MLKLLFKTKYLFTWCVAVVIVTIFAGLIYGTVQQDLRQTANDPQIQLAEDIAAILSSGRKTSDYENPAKIDLSKSLATFLVIYDDKGQPVAGNVQLAGKVPVAPFGVLETAGKRGENHVTWQPQPKVRTAAVIVPFAASTGSGYVLVGRSLREVEIRESFTFKAVLAGWVLSILAISFLIFVSYKFDKVVQL